MSEVSLGEVSKFVRGVTFKPTDLVERDMFTVDCYRTKNVQSVLDRSDVLALPKELVKKSDQFLREGDVLISSANSWNLVGKCSWIPDLGRASTFGGFVTVLRANDRHLDSRYLYRWFNSPTIQATVRRFGNQTTSISNLDLKRTSAMRIPMPSLDEQRRIADILDKTDALRTKRREAIAHLDTLGQSIFHEMFGDPVQQPSSVSAARLDSLGTVKTGNTPPRADSANFGSYVDWIKTDNIKPASAIVGRSVEGLSESGAMKGRTAQPGSVLMTCIAGSPGVIGNVALTDRVLAYNQQINAFTPYSGESFFWLHLLKAMKSSVQRLSTGGMTGLVSKSALSSLIVPDWPEASQRDFAKRIAAVEHVKAAQRAQLTGLDALFASLQDRAFKGEL